MREVLIARAERHDYDDVAMIDRDTIHGKREYGALHHMHFGKAGKVCANVTRNWSPDHVETAMVFCESSYCVAWPAVCGNWSIIDRVEAHAARAESFGNPDGAVAADVAATDARSGVAGDGLAATGSALQWPADTGAEDTGPFVQWAADGDGYVPSGSGGAFMAAGAVGGGGFIYVGGRPGCDCCAPGVTPPVDEPPIWAMLTCLGAAALVLRGFKGRQ